MTTTSVGMRRPECARQRTRVRIARSASNEPTLTYVLIGINVAVASSATLGGASATGGGVAGSTLLEDGSVSRGVIADGEYWRLLTAGFLHAGFFHLLFNMLSLYILGSILEPAIGEGALRVDLFRVAARGIVRRAAGGAACADRGLPGAIFGLMGAAAVVMRKRGISLMESGLGIWIGLNLLLTFTVSNISIGGHIGGLIGGAAPRSCCST